MADETANSQNVFFAYETALAAARELYRMSTVLRSKHGARIDEIDHTGLYTDWIGPKQTECSTKITSEGTDLETLETALVSLANLFATKWSEARGEQDRINHARWAKAQDADDSWGEDAWQSVAGEPDHGPPPENPPVPRSPEYRPTRDPIHPEFENI